MKITRLHKAKNYRIFRDFSWPDSGLPDFARFNVIYGWNGVGKTSLSNIFRMVERRSPLTEGEVEILVDERRVSGSDFGSAALPPVRTFNRDSVDRNVFEKPNQQLPPVFYLGEDSVEKQKRIEYLRKECGEKLISIERWAREFQDASSALEAFCAEEAKGIKNLLTVSGGGPYNNYNAGHFKADVEAMAKVPDLPPLLTDTQRQEYLTIKDGQVMDKVAEASVAFPDVAGLASRTQEMLKRSVTSTVLSALAENPSVASWVGAGLSLHRGENHSATCKFCDQSIPEGRFQQLEAHFNDELKRFILDVDALMAEVQASQDFLKHLRAPPKEALYVKFRPDYERAMSSLVQQATTVPVALEVLVRALKAKRNEPFNTFNLSSFIASESADCGPVGGVEAFFQIVFAGVSALSAAIGRVAFDQIVSLINQHNHLTDAFDAELKTVRKALAQNEVLKAFSQWQEKSTAAAHARLQVATARKEEADLIDQIRELEFQILQHRLPAEELNKEVAAYLGRDELRFEVEQNGYRIMRGGHPAMHLSDGERTAIAFLYFLKSLGATDFNLENGVVVIDDPVSSLDVNSLFSAFGFLKQRAARAGQLFVLTHNFTFFRQVRNWYYNLPGQQKKDESRRPARFYMLSTDFVGGVRAAKLDVLDPFLHQYESEYHYLFKRVYDQAQKESAQNLESYYAIPNIARRLLESFLAFRVPDKPGELFQKLECINYDVSKKTRILRFLHTYSHLDQIAEPDHDPSVLSETPAILREVLELMRESDRDHFARMEQLVAARPAQEPA